MHEEEKERIYTVGYLRKRDDAGCMRKRAYEGERREREDGGCKSKRKDVGYVRNREVAG